MVVDSSYFANNPMDLHFDSAEQAMIDSGMTDLVDSYRQIREYGLPNSTPPALQFNPLPYGFQIPGPTEKISWDIPEGLSRPELEADLQPLIMVAGALDDADPNKQKAFIDSITSGTGEVFFRRLFARQSAKREAGDNNDLGSTETRIERFCSGHAISTRCWI